MTLYYWSSIYRMWRPFETEFASEKLRDMLRACMKDKGICTLAPKTAPCAVLNREALTAPLATRVLRDGREQHGASHL